MKDNPTKTPRWLLRSGPMAFGYLLMLGFSVLLVYHATFAWMWDRWFQRESYYSHGVVIPLVSLFLVWRQRSVLRRVPRTPARGWGFLGVSLALALHLVGAWTRIHVLSGISLVALLSALVWYHTGWPFTRRLLFPLLFLGFMVPAPAAGIASLTLQLKLLVTHLSTALVGVFGLATVREGSIVHLPNTTITVGDPCSGLRSIITLLALGTVYTYLSEAPWYSRGSLLVLTLPIALGTNVLRVMLTLFLANTYGDWVVTNDWVHESFGLLVFLSALILFILAGRMLKCRVPLFQMVS